MAALAGKFLARVFEKHCEAVEQKKTIRHYPVYPCHHPPQSGAKNLHFYLTGFAREHAVLLRPVTQRRERQPN